MTKTLYKLCNTEEMIIARLLGVGSCILTALYQNVLRANITFMSD